MKIKSFIYFLLSLIVPPAFSQQVYDVVVYGGTAGGITASIQVASMGKTVALLEPGKHIGGISVEGLGGSDIDNHQDFQNSPAIGGLALEFYRRIAKAYNRSAAFEQALQNRSKNAALWRFESSVAEKVIRDWLSEYPIKVFYNYRLSEKKKSVKKVGTQLLQIRMENGQVFGAKVFIDATIEGDLLHAAGISTIIGREANSLYGETKNGIRKETTYRQFAVKVDPYQIPGDPKSGVIATIKDEPLGTIGASDHRLQAYCFRMCLTKNLQNRILFSKPEGYDRKQYEIYLRYEKAGGKLYTPVVSIPNEKTDLGAWHDLSHNLYGMNYDYPGGNYATRQQVYDEHRIFTQGLFYFLANDPEVSEDTRQAWSQWGLCKDEFTDNGGWPRQFYVRDARRMISDYVITEHHTNKTNQAPVEDPVGVAFWPPDIHHVRRMVRDGYAYNEGFVFGGSDWSPFGISYKAIIPTKTECVNLLTPTCPSSSHIAYGAIRLEWTFMVLGQSAGTAAVLAIQDNKPVQMLNYEKLKHQLLKDQQVLQLKENDN